jgi:D-serine deaminase-like pyridoxal phosphate-dependent protein
MLDIQQLATSLITHSDISISILARVVSTYPLRKEAMCDAGALAVSKDTGPLAGYGHVVYPPNLTGWDLGRVSQEHGTLVRRPVPVEGAVSSAGEAEGKGQGEAEIGDLVRIVPQHACLACACYPWYYVVEDEGEEIVDVWVPCRGW